MLDEPISEDNHFLQRYMYPYLTPTCAGILERRGSVGTWPVNINVWC